MYSLVLYKIFLLFTNINIGDSNISINASVYNLKKGSNLHLVIENVSSDTILCYGSKRDVKKYGKELYGSLYQLDNNLCSEPWDTFHDEVHQSYPECIILLPKEKYTVDVWIPSFSYTYGKSFCYRYQVLKNDEAVFNKWGINSKLVGRLMSKTLSKTLQIPLSENSYK